MGKKKKKDSNHPYTVMCSSVLPQHPKLFKAAEPDQPHNSQYVHHPAHSNDSHSQHQAGFPILNYCPENSL